jgi:hypothetical protein
LRSPCAPKGPVWLCSGKGRSSSSTSVSRQSPVESPAVAQSPGDYFESRPSKQGSPVVTDLDIKVAEALAAEAALAKASRPGLAANGGQSESVVSSHADCRVDRPTDWFRGVVV